MEHNKYNILVTLNSSYFEYGSVFINSLFDNNDMDLVENVFIADVGLENKHRKFFEKYPKVSFIDSSIKTDFNNGGTWGEGWVKAVTSKTKFLLKSLEISDKGVMMIDSDCLIIKPLHPLISNEDIQVCDRSFENKSNPFLGSYVYIQNNDIGKSFVKKWCQHIENSKISGAKESPALYETIKMCDPKYIKKIDRVMVSCYNKTEYNNCKNKPFIVHFKGRSLSENTHIDKQKRLFGGHGFNAEIEKYLHNV